MTDKKINVAIFHCGFVYSGGGERIVLEEAKGLIKRNYNVKVYAPTIDHKKCYPELLKEVGVKSFLPSFIDKLPYRNALRMVISSLFAPILSLNFRNTDIFIGANQPGAWIAFCMAKILRKPYIVYLNQPNRVTHPRPVDVKYGWYSTEKDFHVLYKIFGLVRPFLGILDKTSITASNRVLVNGGYIGDVIENVYSVKTIDTPAGANFVEFEKINSDINKIYGGKIKIGKHLIPKPYALITNRHDPQKRFDYVIRAMSLVLKKFPKASLIIPGPFTEHTKHLMKLVKELGIEGKIYFLGQIKETELQKLYKNTCVYCYPSPQEDFGLGPIEAGGWGVPTVAWNHAGPTVTVENNITGFLASPYEIKDYANKMLLIFKNPKLRITMGKSAWENTKNKFSWSNHLDVLEETIARLT
jgi:glycosyltransferase involved in cell wall biosynthesis